MTILLFKDGRLLIAEDGKPIEPDKARGDLVISISDPKEGDVLTFNGTYWTNAPLPEPEDEHEDNGGGVTPV